MSFSLSISSIFTYADAIITAMMPVVYVAAGISLGFIVVNKIIGAFR